MNYSIIIPHKNSTKQLQRCLDSIPFRDDLEVIIVDDNSDPEVVDFDNFPGKERPNTIVGTMAIREFKVNRTDIIV